MIKSCICCFRILVGLQIIHILVLNTIWLTDCVNVEADLNQFLMVKNETSIEDESRLGHSIIHFLVVVVSELVPLCHNSDSVSSFYSLVRICLDGHTFLELATGSKSLVVVEVHLYLFVLNLWVVYGDLSPFGQKMLSYIYRCGLAGISSILLEGKAEQKDLLSRNCVEHRLDHLLSKSEFLMVVDLHYLVPILSNLGQTKTFAEVHEVEDILLEARTTESYRSIEEALSNTAILTDSARNLLNVSS
mmetsp:Transcript_11141/g.15529  ORF Transcript_11141/g.15529 Transcript_11141/m.15529 type:complete len:247 (-) Transcript_11141:803-1543(-)